MAEWKIVASAGRDRIEAALNRAETLPDTLVATGFELASDRPDEWRLEVFCCERPSDADRAAVAALFDGDPPGLTMEELPETDWVVASQQAAEPIVAGQFRVRTPDFPATDDPALHEFVIPAAQAFGTGQHETTAGCLAMLALMRDRGFAARNLADIGTGTGLLAFAALHLWPQAHAIASDIDPVCEGVIRENMVLNRIAAGDGAGELALTIAAGVDDPALQARAPYDLLIANILAGPLIELAPAFVKAMAPGGSVVLAGLLETQEADVVAAYEAAGCERAERATRGDWAILWLRRRAG